MAFFRSLINKGTNAVKKTAQFGARKTKEALSSILNIPKNLTKTIIKGTGGAATLATKAKLYATLGLPLSASWHMIGQGLFANAANTAINQSFDIADAMKTGYNATATGPSLIRRIPGLIGAAGWGVLKGGLFHGIDNTIGFVKGLGIGGLNAAKAWGDAAMDVFNTGHDTVSMTVKPNELSTHEFIKKTSGQTHGRLMNELTRSHGERKGFNRRKEFLHRNKKRDEEINSQEENMITTVENQENNQPNDFLDIEETKRQSEGQKLLDHDKKEKFPTEKNKDAALASESKRNKLTISALKSQDIEKKRKKLQEAIKEADNATKENPELNEYHDGLSISLMLLAKTYEENSKDRNKLYTKALDSAIIAIKTDPNESNIDGKNKNEHQRAFARIKKGIDALEEKNKTEKLKVEHKKDQSTKEKRA